MTYPNNEGDFEIGPAEIEIALREYEIDWRPVIEDALEPGVELAEMRQHYKQLHADDEKHRLRLVADRNLWRGRCHTAVCVAGLSWLLTLVVGLVR